MKNNTRTASREDIERADLVTRINALLAKKLPAEVINNRAAAFKDAAKRATSAVAKPKASLRSLKEAERDLAMFHGLGVR